MKKQKNKPVPAEKPAYHHGDLRRSLLDAALLLVESRGVQAFTLREAARAANVSHNAPYRHFPSRTHLLIELAIEGHGHLLAALRSATQSVDHPQDRLIRLGIAYMEFAISHSAHFRVMFSGEAVTNPTEELTAAQLASYRYFESEILASEQAGLIRQGHVEQYALAGWSALHGAALLVLDGVLNSSSTAARRKPRDIARMVLETLFTGILDPH